MSAQDQLLVVILLWIMAPLLFVVLLAAPFALLPVVVRLRRVFEARSEMPPGAKSLIAPPAGDTLDGRQLPKICR